MKGFTLIELLAVIVILAIILLISIPMIGNLIEGVKKEAFSNSTLGLVSAANHSYVKEKLSDYEGEIIFTITDGVIASEPTGKKIEIDGELPKNGTIKINKEGLVQLSVHNGKYCAIKLSNQSKLDVSIKPLADCIIDETAPTIDLATNGGEFYYLSLKPTITDFSEITSLSYVFSESDEEPTTGWVSFNQDNPIIYSGSGTYYLHIKATDKPGNTRKFVSSPFILLDPVTNFTYKGVFEEFTVKTTGKYKLEVWGAKGGGLYGGKGGYATGEITLNKDDKLFVYVGGEGNFTSPQSLGGFNGGGKSGSHSTQGGGGGATDIRLTNNILASRIIVGAGGGGAGSNQGANNPGDVGGAGGGLTGISGSGAGGGGGAAGTQTSGGSGGVYSGWSSGTSGTLLTGGNGAQGGGGGGAGYYGGGGASWSGAGGGSSYVGTLEKATTINGNTSMPNPLGGNQTGNATNGYARLTFLP